MTKPPRTAESAAVGREWINPEASHVVLVGAASYRSPDLTQLPSVRHNLASLRRIFLDPRIGGFPEDRVSQLLDPTQSAEIGNLIRKAAAQATDTLIVYYAGHGLIDDETNNLLLTHIDSVHDAPDLCLPVEHLRRAIHGKGQAKRRVLIIDCCYSGLADGRMGPAEQAKIGSRAAARILVSAAPTQRGPAAGEPAAPRPDTEAAEPKPTEPDDRPVRSGWYTMASAPPDRKAHAEDPDSCTAFTGALVKVITEGAADGRERLSLDFLFDQTRALLEREFPKAPSPEQASGRTHIGALGFVRNPAAQPAPAPDPVLTPPRPSRRRLALFSTAFALAGVGVGAFGVPAAVDAYQRWNPAPAVGACSERAVLLDHSDGLDKKDVEYEPVEGLSGLALAPGSRAKAYAVTDNEPGRIFPVDLGEPERLAPVAEKARTLRQADGSAFEDSWFDAEALAVEQGGRTALVASETGPSIRRFDLVTGRQVGEDLAIPKELRYWPEGGAQTGRSIESLALSPDGRHLYAGWEAPLAQDGDTRGRGIIRVQRYTGTPGGAYRPDESYAYLAGDGLMLADLAAVGGGRLLALERQYTLGRGNAVRVVEIDLTGARDVTGVKSLFRLPADALASSKLLFDLADCPPGGPGAVATSEGDQANPLLDNVEGMALGPRWTAAPHPGRHPLYLVSDDNGNSTQITRVYSLAVDLGP
ncbi:esterase-like activity of phytase family protein [Streptomyces sp. NPDC058372]|uniref:caspase, EACC1-associated type n=1 Tax=Streptomyces sp. NPDC058372 TaxID=3346464 RepID=UPI00365C1058